ncbi:hypothetical protein B9P52_31825 [Achromobacter denitrificans]|uniref:hypothetical protein n=1 Tax=Achromobacter denitrificans TaxID=32002 RepID=UPI000B4C8197|nr:hypothetical protein [Achromobacter denitrificans]ASC68586.1 hypothetical protein B9P52_31825 [Achromobacter denitrificans]
MQHFQDTATGQYWALDDDVAVTVAVDGLIFRNALGELLASVPKTLVAVAEIPEPEPQVNIPRSVSRWQGREAMLLTRYGNPADRVSVFDAVVELMSHAETPAYYVRAWEELQDFERDSPTLIAIADELGLASDDLDALFLLAASLRA